MDTFAALTTAECHILDNCSLENGWKVSLDVLVELFL